MTQRTWVILGATSIIAEKFAHIAAKQGHPMRLVGRDKDQLEIRAQDIRLRYHVPCDVRLFGEFLLDSAGNELDLFLAQSDSTENDQLTSESILRLIDVNISTNVLIIQDYLKMNQSQHHILYISSVAALRGRAKNSLYGASKKAIEVFLEGLQQKANSNQHITIARLGFIDTQQTYGKPGVFYAAKPENCAKACWNAMRKGKRMIYYPFFWRIIMGVIRGIPFIIYKKMGW